MQLRTQMPPPTLWTDSFPVPYLQPIFAVFYSPTQIYEQSLQLESHMMSTPAMTSSPVADQSGWFSTSLSRCISMQLPMVMAARGRKTQHPGVDITL